MPNIDKVLNDCEFAFFAELIKHYPNVTTGNFPPDASNEFRDACMAAIVVWLKCNPPSNAAPCDGCDVVVVEGDHCGHGDQWLCPDCYTD